MSIRPARGILLTLALLGLLPGCQGRDRLNPLDPGNPDTGGTPDNLDAVASDGEVVLSWRDLGLDDLEGYDLLRTDGASPETTVLNGPEVLPPDAAEWADRDVTNGETYAYRLRFRASDGSVSLSRPDSATPGPTVAWAVDRGSPSLRRISPDGRDLVQSVTGLAGPRDLAVSPDGDDLWVADYFGGRVIRYDGSGTQILSVDFYSTGGGMPVSVGFDPADRSVWVGGRVDDGPDRVVHLAADGTEVGRYAGIPNPIALDVDAGDGAVWVCAFDGGAVFLRAPGDSGFTEIGGFDRPVSVAADPNTGRCWIADGRGVTLLDRGGQVVLFLGTFDSARALAVDASDGACWVAHILSNGTWSASRVGPSGIIGNGASGFEFIGGMAANPEDGTAWLSSVGSETGEIVKLSREGSILGRVGRLSYPTAIGLVPRGAAPP